MVHGHSVLVHKFEFAKQLVVVPQRHHTFRRRIEALPLTNFQLDVATQLLNSSQTTLVCTKKRSAIINPFDNEFRYFITFFIDSVITSSAITKSIIASSFYEF
ncbi:unnamed protein product [Ceratitis capitata]|uniref:(Mediterranean fruit fly) hypothetical protein n=1 Tax=Ceratitis capitata TaxID=7213 RepID=A0A811UWY8_CERCA|nr:unnamed protein product [Ceratitis capitata]